MGSGGKLPGAMLYGQIWRRFTAGIHGDAVDLALQRHLHEREHKDMDKALLHRAVLWRFRADIVY